MTSGFAIQASRSICTCANKSAVLAHWPAGGSSGQRERR